MEDFKKWPLLGGISSPDDLKHLGRDEVVRLAAEIRDYLVFRVGENGGHLASNLGVVELTLALHRVFNSPTDHLVFDVGHQSYVHKLLTGRKEQFDTLRTVGGLSGFTKREESAHDPFGAGHSSTAVSAALGIAKAEKMRGGKAWTVAVVGDGALTGGLSYEALNNCDPNLRLIIIINENEMSISPNTGHLARHLGKLRASRGYIKTKEFASGALSNIPIIGKPMYELLRSGKRWLKRRVYQENLFEHMGIRYLGPMEGDNVEDLEACLRHARKLDCSIILHIKTRKGAGYRPAEQDPNAYHALPPAGKRADRPNFSAVFGKALCRLADERPSLCAITAAMSCGTGLEDFRKACPDRFFDVGIAEGHAITFAAGLSAAGMHPVVALYSTFLQRAYDNLLHDVALQHLPLTLCIDRAGFSRGDGVTHHGIFDVAMLGAIPDISLYTPITEQGVVAALRLATDEKALCAIRYPNTCENPRLMAAFYPNGINQSARPTVRVWGAPADTAALTIVTHGRIAAEVLTAAERLVAEGVAVRILLCEYIMPYAKLASELAPLLGGAVLFVEEEIRAGGFGVCLADALTRSGAMAEKRFAMLATDNPFLTPVIGQTYLQAAGLDADAIVAKALELTDKGD